MYADGRGTRDTAALYHWGRRTPAMSAAPGYRGTFAPSPPPMYSTMMADGQAVPAQVLVQNAVPPANQSAMVQPYVLPPQIPPLTEAYLQGNPSGIVYLMPPQQVQADGIGRPMGPSGAGGYVLSATNSQVAPMQMQLLPMASTSQPQGGMGGQVYALAPSATAAPPAPVCTNSNYVMLPDGRLAAILPAQYANSPFVQ